jgi:hypothetical protein
MKKMYIYELSDVTSAKHFQILLTYMVRYFHKILLNVFDMLNEDLHVGIID